MEQATSVQALSMRTISALILCFLSLSALADGESPASPKKPFLPNRLDISLPEQVIASNSEISVSFDFLLPANHHLNLEAPSRIVVTSPGTELNLTNRISELTPQINLPARPLGNGVIEYSAMLYYCEDGNTTLCKIRGVAMTQPYRATEDGAKAMEIKAVVPD